MLTGATGTGKSYSLWCLAKAAIKGVYERYDPDIRPRKLRGIECFKFRDIVSEINRLTFDRERNESVGEYLNSLCDNTLLFIDDMTVRMKNQAAESPYRWAYEAVNALTDKWWDNHTGGGLYITTNNTPTELADAFGDPLVDRLRGMCERVELTGKSNR